MPTRIKNCGLKSSQAIDEAIRTGAHFAGFVHHAPSPRHVDLETLTALIAHARGRIKTVAVLQAPTQAQLWEITNLAKPDYLQLHHVPADHIQAILDDTGIPIISALSVRTESDLALAATLEEISDYLLFDAAQPGSGKRFDWHLLKNLALKKPWFLAGGLTAENVAEAIRATHAPMVDVSSGIESAPGVKSLEKIAAFNAAVMGSKP